MEIVRDFEDILALLEKHEGRYLIIDGLIAIKRLIDHPRHREDVRVLEEVRKRRSR